MNIDGASILVTAGCGFIGSSAIDLLLKEYAPARIVILDNLVRGSLANVEAALKDPRVTLVRGDIRDAPTSHRFLNFRTAPFYQIIQKMWERHLAAKFEHFAAA